MSARSRRGAALVEVLIAVVILATAGTGLVVMLGQASHSMRSTRTTERELDSVSAVMDRLVMFDRAALVARDGWTRQGAWFLRIERVSASLFDVAVARSAGGSPVLQTTLYRPDSADARP